MAGPTGPYELTFSRNSDEGELQARLPGGVLCWHVETSERAGGEWLLGGLTRGTREIWGETYWFELRTGASARIDYFAQTLVRSDYAVAA